MSGFSGVALVRVPQRCVCEAHTHLRQMGSRGDEGIALWVGTVEETTFHVTRTLIPRQLGVRTLGGICITVDGDELHRINMWLYEQGLRLIAQLHSHPTEAYHSETDDTYPIATTQGCLSLVIPDFAVRPFTLDECAVYRLDQRGTWQELTVKQVASLIQLIED
jgi:hypothetical protein